MSRSNQDNVEQSLSMIFAREEDLRKALLDEAEAKHLYEVKQAKEILKAEGTEKVKVATALIACEDEYLDYLRKKAVATFTREAIQDAQQALSARQTLLTASVKSDFGYANDRRTV